MKKEKLFACLLTVGLVQNSFAATFNFATGQDSSDNIQNTSGALDAYWKTDNGNYAKVVVPGDTDWYGGWADINSLYSSWVTLDNNTPNNGSLSLTYSFDLTGYDLSTAVFENFQYSIDDSGDLYLNETLIDNSPYWGGGPYYFESVSLPTNFLHSGINTIRITERDTDNYLEALRVEGTLKIDQSAGPDLVGEVESYNFNNATNTIHIDFKVTNTGVLAASKFFVTFNLSDNGKKVSSKFNTSSITKLNPGASQTISIDYTSTTSLYSKYILILIDPAHKITEMDETNNGTKIVIQPMTTK